MSGGDDLRDALAQDELARRRAASEAAHPSTRPPATMIVERPTTRTGLEALRVATLSLEDRLPTEYVHLAQSIALAVLCDLDDHGYMLIKVDTDHG